MRVFPAPLIPQAVPSLFAVVAVTLLPHVQHLPFWLAAVSLGLFAWRLWTWHSGTPLPGPLPLFAMVVAGTAAILIEYGTIFGQEPGVALLALFMALKLQELRLRRDAVVVVMLGYFLLLTHYFFSEGILVGIWMLFALVIITAALIRIHSAAAHQSPLAMLRMSTAMLGQSLPLALVLFLLFPRISGPLWGLPQNVDKATTGLSDEMSPGSISEVSRSAAIAFRIRFDTPPPPLQTLYWRGPVLNDYDGRTWHVGRTALAASDNTEVLAQSPIVRYSVTLEPHQRRWLLALDMPISVPDGSRLTSSISVVRKEPVSERLLYSTSSSVNYIANPRERPEVLRSALALPPELNPRARELARSWRNSGSDPAALVNKALRLFRSQNFVYTLQPPPLLDPDAIDDFLFRTRRGFCEHYASAFVFLMRAAGVPARIVTGYQGGETNPIDGHLVVRQSDAHAWAEIWSENRGWSRVDPTAAIAPSRVERGIASAVSADDPLPLLARENYAWLRRLRYQWDAANNVWNQWVLGYNGDRQAEILARLGLSRDWPALIAMLAAGAGTAVFAMTAWILRRRRDSDPALQLWQRYCARMARAGIPRNPSEGPRSYGRRVATAKPELAIQAIATSEAFERLHYGDAAPDDIAVLKAALRNTIRQ